MKNKDKKISYRVVYGAVAAVLTLVLVLAFVCLIRANKLMVRALKYGNSNTREYSKHYVLILDNPDADSSRELLKGCQVAGERQDVYVELFQSDLGADYTRVDLVKMAIAADVDGIILEAQESDEFAEAIKSANDNQIPVVTVGKDCMESARISYVGIGAYDLGREYGRQIIRDAVKSDKKVMILMDRATDDSTQNIIFKGIKETLLNEGNHLNMELEIVAVDGQNYFTADESIRNILSDRGELPDFVVCLTEQETLIMYNAVVDYNIVGQVKVLGYYASDAILQAIDKQIITSTVVTDYAIMGESAVNALVEYSKTSMVNGYFLMDVHTINYSNIKEYLGREEN